MEQEPKIVANKQRHSVIIASAIIILIISGVAYWAFLMAMRAETNVRSAGLQSVVAAQLAKTIDAMEMSATNVFNEVEKHMDTPEAVIEALESEASLNPEVRGYFAAFEPYFFPQRGKWFEPYVHHTDSTKFEMTQVGSARHDYTQSEWYKHAKDIKMSFWSEPYYYYDGTSISGHYCTFVKPVFSEDGQLLCVCGADLTFEWLTKALQRIDEWCRQDQQVNKYRLMRDFEFFSIVVDRDGTCIVHPEGKNVSLSAPDVLEDIQMQKHGVREMEVAGVPSYVFYGPIDGIDWMAAIVVPKSDMMKPFIYVGLLLLVLALLGIVAICVISKRFVYAAQV